MTDWREDNATAARELLTIVNDRSSFARGTDGAVTRRWTPGSFVTALVECMLRADQTNLALLHRGFPAHAFAVRIYKDAPDGLVLLRRVAGWPDDPMNERSGDAADHADRE